MKPTEICFFSPGAYPLFNPTVSGAFGGAELQSFLLSSELSKDPGFVVSFIVGDYGQPPVETFNGITVYKLAAESKQGPALWRQISFAIRLWRLLKTVRADVYQQRASGASAGIIALYCRKARKKFIYMTASEADLKGGLRNRTFVEERMFKFGLTNADLIFTQNSQHQQILKEKFHRESIVLKNVLTIPARDVNQKRESVLWVASSQPLKQPEMFLQLARDFSSEKFVMIMPPHAHNQALAEKITEEAEAISNLTLLGKVPFEQITEYYGQAKVLVSTSTFEGFPNTFVQAAASATPILSLGVNPDNFLDKEKCGFCAGGDYKKMATQLSEILGNPALWKSLSENGYRYALENHDIVRNTARYKSAVAELLRNE